MIKMARIVILIRFDFDDRYTYNAVSTNKLSNFIVTNNLNSKFLSTWIFLEEQYVNPYNQLHRICLADA